MARLGFMNAMLGLALGCALSAGCGDDSEDNSTDGSVAADAGKSDAGATSDASTGTDAGVLKGNVTAGKAAVDKNICATCHTGSVGLLAGQDLGSKGANITPDVATGIGSWTEAQIITALLTGKDDEGKMLCATMPVYGGVITAQDAADIAAYLKSIPAISHQSAEACP